MTETEWLTCTWLHVMGQFARRRISRRKSRLFAVACCRRIWHLITDDRSREAVEVAESYALQEVERKVVRVGRRPPQLEDLRAAARAARQAAHELAVSPREIPTTGRYHAALNAAHAASFAADKGRILECAWRAADALADANDNPDAAPASEYDAIREAESAAQCDLLREIIGPLLFRFVSLKAASLAWNDGTLERMALAIYVDGRFEDVPILADALEEAGCDNADILQHCRSSGPHVRGCWVLDLLLGKE